MNGRSNASSIAVNTADGLRLGSHDIHAAKSAVTRPSRHHVGERELETRALRVLDRTVHG